MPILERLAGVGYMEMTCGPESVNLEMIYLKDPTLYPSYYNPNSMDL